MDSEKSNQESEIGGKAAESTIKSSKPPAVLNNDHLFGDLVRRSPRAPGRVKTNFNDVFSKESGAKKRVADGTTQSCDESEVSTVPPDIPCYINTADGRKVDAHCWICHKAKPDQEPEDLSYCVKCVRVFHFECLKKSLQKFNDGGLCPECKTTSLDGTKMPASLTLGRLGKLLTYALNTLMKNAEQLKKFHYSQKQSEDLVYPINLPKLLQNIEQQHYESTAEFLSDVKWILHNLQILPGVNRTLINNARNLVKSCREEMLDIEACPDCYAHLHSREDNWFSKLCSVNHTLAWVKIKGFPYWPAKILKVIDGMADVRFFGTHEKALVKLPCENCYWLSKESPNHKMPQQTLFKAALTELELYIKSAQKKYGPIKYYPLQTKYDPVSQNICTKQAKRKREHSNSGPQPKSKRQSTTPVLMKDLRVELSKKIEAKGISSPQVLKDSSETASAGSSSKGPTNPPEKQGVLKKGTVVSNTKSTAADKSSKAAKAVKTGAPGPAVQKNVANRNGPSAASPCVSKKCSGSSGKLPLPREGSTISSTKQNTKSKGSSVKRTQVKKPQKQTNQLNPEPGASSDSSSDTELVEDSHSVMEESSCNEIVQLLESAEMDTQDITLSEARSSNNESSFVPDEVADDNLPVSVEENMPSNTDTEEPAFVSGSQEANPDTMLEYFEEESDNQNDFPYEPVSTPTYEYIGDSGESTQNQRPEPFSVEVSTNESMEPDMIQHELYPCSYCVPITSREHPQENRYICTAPLPEGLSMQKYQDRVSTTIRATVEEIWHDYVNSRNVRALLFQAQQEKEDLELRYKKEAEDVAKNTNLIISGLQRKHAEALEALRRKCEKEKEEAINEMKKKLLCMHCGKKAMFFCCGDNSCCDHPCQKAHWVLEEVASSAHVNSSGDPQSPDSSVCNTWKTINKEQPRFHSEVMSNKSQTLSSPQHTTTGSRPFARPQFPPPPPLVSRPPDAILNRPSSVPPDPSLFVHRV